MTKLDGVLFLHLHLGPDLHLSAALSSMHFYGPTLPFHSMFGLQAHLPSSNWASPSFPLDCPPLRRIFCCSFSLPHHSMYPLRTRAMALFASPILLLTLLHHYCNADSSAPERQKIVSSFHGLWSCRSTPQAA